MEVENCVVAIVASALEMATTTGIRFGTPHVIAFKEDSTLPILRIVYVRLDN